MAEVMTAIPKTYDLLVRLLPTLAKFRFLCRLASDMHYFGRDRYYTLAERVDEIGRMIGGWMAAQPQRWRERP